MVEISIYRYILYLRIENTGRRPGLWEKMKDQENKELQMSQPFSLLNDQLPLLESVALHAKLAC